MWFFIDYEKAFDTIDYTLLLNKLSYYGIKDIVSGWSKSYLSNRTHYRSINRFNSSIEIMKYDVPRGPFLGGSVQLPFWILLMI